MKKKIYLWAAFVLPLLFVACSDDKNDDPVDPVLKFKEAEVIADPAGGTYTAELESNVAWTVTSKSSNISSLNMESGKGNATLSFFVSPKTGDDVTGNITVKAASSALTAVLTVKQDKISIAIGPADTTASMDGGEFKAKLVCNTEWEVTGVAGSFEGADLGDSGKGDHTFTLKIGANESEETLVYELTVSTKFSPLMEAMEATYTITQGVPSLEYGGVTYKIVKLADDRWWMAENLRYLPAGKTPSSDPADGNGVWYPGFLGEPATDAASVEKMGYLYDYATAFGVSEITASNWNQQEGKQGICPEGWHIPTKAELDALAGAGNEAEGIAPGKYYVAEQKGAPLADLNGAGFDVVLSGAINKKTDQAEGKYASNAKDLDYNSLGYFMGSTGYQFKLNDKTGATTAQSYSMLLTNNATYQRAQVMYGPIFGGQAVRCIKDEAK